ncbi:retrovirus-related pol polyprotein from transposon TNT 1-94 [Tanacetum coccineum]
MELYMQNREHGIMILESLENGPLIWPTIEENGVIKTKKYDELSAAKKIQANCDMQATNIILQDQPADIYSLEKECDDSPFCLFNKARLFNYCSSLRYMGRQGQSYSGTGYKSNATNSGGNNESGKAWIVKCFNNQRYPHSETYLNDMENQSVHAMQDFEQTQELPKISLVNESLKKLKFHLAKFDNVVKIRTTPNARTEGEWGFEHTKAVFNNEIIPFLKSLKDIFNVFDRDLLNEIMEVFKKQFDSIKQTRVRSKEHSDSLIDKINLKSAENEDLKAQIQDKAFVITMFKLDLEPLSPMLLQNREAHIYYLKYTQEQADILRGIVEQAKAAQPLDKELDFALPKRLLSHPKTMSRKVALCTSFPQATLNRCSKHMTGNRSQLMNFVSKIMGTVRFRNDNIARIMGYGDYQLGNVTISRVYYVEGLEHNLFSVSQFCDADLERQSLRAGYGHVFISLNLECALGKRKKSSHQPKVEDTNQEKLYLLHVDLYGPMRVASINGKMYILVIVDDYSRFTWDKKSDLSFFDVFGALCYPTNENDDRGKLDAKADIAMASEQVSSDAGYQMMLHHQGRINTEQEQSPNISQGFKESPKTPIFRDDPLNESPHEESTPQGSSSNVRQTHTPFEHLVNGLRTINMGSTGTEGYAMSLQLCRCMPRGGVRTLDVVYGTGVSS